jgi:nitrate/TMAO reductase-like tetraheme cytochrome c subunit
MRKVIRQTKRVLWPGGKWRWPLRMLILLPPMSLVLVEVTSQSWFCDSCHIMNSYYASWQKGPHKDVECVSCHIPPGATNFVSAKLNGLGQVVDDVLQRTSSKPSASVSDFSCTRSGCHSLDKLKDEGKHVARGTNYLFDHGKHLGLDHDGVKVHCTICHSHVKGDQHFQVDTNACVTCHLAYPKPEKASATVQTVAFSEPAKPQPAVEEHAQKMAPGACQTCHNVPDKPIQYQGLEVNHSEYVSYGAACGSCHRGATDAAAKVKDDQCFSCHDFGKERLGSVRETHLTHSAGRHKVQCVSCHGITRHGPVAQAMHLNQIECVACHKSQHNVQQTAYKSLDPLAGATSPTTKPAVTPMFLAHVDCGGCHIEQKSLNAKPLSGATVAKATAEACDACHKPGLGEKMIPMWQKSTHASYDAVVKLLPERTPVSPEAAKLVENARHLLDLVKVDGSWGVHNPRYTQRLLEEAERKLREATDLEAGKVEARAHAAAEGGGP